MTARKTAEEMVAAAHNDGSLVYAVPVGEDRTCVFTLPNRVFDLMRAYAAQETAAYTAPLGGDGLIGTQFRMSLDGEEFVTFIPRKYSILGGLALRARKAEAKLARLQAALDKVAASGVPFAREAVATVRELAANAALGREEGA